MVMMVTMVTAVMKMRLTMVVEPAGPLRETIALRSVD